MSVGCIIKGKREFETIDSKKCEISLDVFEQVKVEISQ